MIKVNNGGINLYIYCDGGIHSLLLDHHKSGSKSQKKNTAGAEAQRGRAGGGEDGGSVSLTQRESSRNFPQGGRKHQTKNKTEVSLFFVVVVFSGTSSDRINGRIFNLAHFHMHLHSGIDLIPLPPQKRTFSSSPAAQLPVFLDVSHLKSIGLKKIIKKCEQKKNGLNLLSCQSKQTHRR